MKILIAVTHLLGMGHFARMRMLARGLSEAGHAVTLVSGGRPVPHGADTAYKLVQLPPVHCIGTDFATLYESDGVIVSAETRAKRIALVRETLARVRPDIVITETFPFGRRALKSEFLALCEAAHALRPRPAIVSSIRDILNPPSTMAKADEAEWLIGRFYDGVLVHGDSDWVAPDHGWPFGSAGRKALRLTGYIDEAAPTERAIIPHGRILVSGGGSAASLPLYRAAIGAAQALPHTQWHVLVGHGVSEADFSALVEAAPASMLVERARKDFRALLRGACLSISQAGYNTIVDLFDAAVPMILVPFAAGQEQEQTLRAEALAAVGVAHLVREDALSATNLVHAVEKALSVDAPSLPQVNRDGVTGSIVALREIAAQRDEIERAWAALTAELAALRQSGEMIALWWRDDDAVSDTPALRRLLALSDDMQAPLALAVIPANADSSLAAACAGSNVDVLIHGLAHSNNAPAGAKKQELGFRAPADWIAPLQEAQTRLRALFGERFCPVLVPPWNRIDPALLPLLPSAGIAGLSTFKLRDAPFAAPGLQRINTHCDPVAWRAGGGLAPEAALVDHVTQLCRALACQPANAREPLGLLTHHLVHDEAIWAFLRRLLETMMTSGAVHCVAARTIFDVHQTVPLAAVLE